MKGFTLIILAMLTMLLSSCEAVEGIFKAGMWTAFLIVGLVVAIILWIVFKSRRK